VPAVIRGYGQRAFDQGLGRSLWFVGGADPDYIIPAIRRFPSWRRNDLWSGVGLACVYAGGAEIDEVNALCSAVGHSWTHLAQGAAFAAAARHRAGNITSQTENNCKVICGLSVSEASEICNQTLSGIGIGEGAAAYEIWRHLIRNQMIAIKAPKVVA
jgi:enediyne biosynthesis protein E3